MKDHDLACCSNTLTPRLTKETLINSEFPQHMDVLPFSVADKPLKMKNKIKSLTDYQHPVIY